jgi:hypothetical protein
MHGAGNVKQLYSCSGELNRAAEAGNLDAVRRVCNTLGFSSETVATGVIDDVLQSAFTECCMAGHEHVAQWFWDLGRPLTVYDEVFQVLATKGDIRMLQWLRNKATCDSRRFVRMVIRAQRAGQKPMVKYLLNTSPHATTAAVDSMMYELFYYPCKLGWVKYVLWFVDKFPDLIRAKIKDVVNCLCQHSQRGCIGILKRLNKQHMFQCPDVDVQISKHHMLQWLEDTSGALSGDRIKYEATNIETAKWMLRKYYIVPQDIYAMLPTMRKEIILWYANNIEWPTVRAIAAVLRAIAMTQDVRTFQTFHDKYNVKRRLHPAVIANIAFDASPKINSWLYDTYRDTEVHELVSLNVRPWPFGHEYTRMTYGLHDGMWSAVVAMHPASVRLFGYSTWWLSCRTQLAAALPNSCMFDVLRYIIAC